MIELYSAGDLYIADKQTLQFHKGEKYEICRVFHNKGELIATIKDKNGVELIFDKYLFNSTSKNTTNILNRHLKSLLEFWYSSKDGSFINWQGWNKESEVYEMSQATFCSNLDAVCGVKTIVYFNDRNDSSFKKISESKSQLFNSKEECINFYFNKLKLVYNDQFYSIHMEGLKFGIQEKINLQSYIISNNIPNLPINFNVEIIKYRDLYKNYDLSFDKLISFLNEFIFDSKITDSKCKEYIQEVIKLYIAMPASYAATAATKILLGKLDVKNKNLDPFSGKFINLDLKSEQLFSFVDFISTYLYHNKIFIPKESYSSAPEWRNQFEFIGNKAIDNKINDYLN